MSYTLDQLLDETGINAITGEHLNKKASLIDPQDLSKLAERCRQAVNATPDERVSAEQELLIEKTAAVEIIGRTLAEIRSIDIPPEQVKTASEGGPDATAEFIKAALDQGYRPEQVAEFIEKNAILGRLIRRGREFGATRSLRKAMKTTTRGEAGTLQAQRKFENLVRDMENVPTAQKANLLNRMRVEIGPQSTHAVISSAGGRNWKELGSFKSLQKEIPKAAPGTPEAIAATRGGVGVSIGGTQYGLSKEQLGKIKKPAMYAGAGVMAHRAIAGPKKNDSGGKGRPVIITG